ncbi:hypothetical protein SADUNF_Sadunf04G0099000 [Salix dunnii]|uniref:Uncharacterized protein n=1 Tax=Salix dunnii TaxID=1413687 RepID=A0A835KE41_9ROSI|nr:hypothetical protein SADUNF_Sadunf04G0099000 [Salix dunnii]
MELGVIRDLQGQVTAKSGASQYSSSFLKATTMTLFTISESQKASYVDQIYSYLGDHPFMNKLINIVVRGIIDERAVNIRTHGIGCTVVNIRTQECVEFLVYYPRFCLNQFCGEKKEQKNLAVRGVWMPTEVTLTI